MMSILYNIIRCCYYGYRGQLSKRTVGEEAMNDDEQAVMATFNFLSTDEGNSEIRFVYGVHTPSHSPHCKPRCKPHYKQPLPLNICQSKHL